MPSLQGVPVLAQGAFIPWHSFAPQDDISVLGNKDAINPSEQNPPAQVCPMGHLPPDRQGSLAEPPFHLPKCLVVAEPANTFTRTKHTNTTTRIKPRPDVRFKDIPSDVVSENAPGFMGTQVVDSFEEVEYPFFDRIH